MVSRRGLSTYPAASTTYEAEDAANTKGGSAANATCSGCSGGTKVGFVGNGAANTLTFSNATAWAPDFDAIEVRSLPGTNGIQLAGQQSGRCLDINDNTITNATDAQLWDCSGGENQAWVRTTVRKELVVYGNKCLDAYQAGTANGTKGVLWTCNGGSNQKWTQR